MKRGEETRRRILDAALEALRTRGFGGTSTRAIAEIGGFNPALTFYYFGSLQELLLSALEEASRGRLERWEREARAAPRIRCLVSSPRFTFRILTDRLN